MEKLEMSVFVFFWVLSVTQNFYVLLYTNQK